MLVRLKKNSIKMKLGKIEFAIVYFQYFVDVCIYIF